LCNNNHYNKKLKGLARGLRKSSTKAEIILWTDLLRAKSMRGYAFLRQRPIGNYIVDFFSKELKLVIEVDGITHEYKQREDAEKDLCLTKLGYKVLRFEDDDILNHLDVVATAIEYYIDKFEDH
jgi:very-short-patch-repair endonuclease